MKFSLISLISIVSCSNDDTALVADLLKRGRAPGIVFQPFEKSGSPEIFHKSEAPALLQKDKVPSADATDGGIPLHIEQFIDFKDTPFSEEENGF